MRHKHSTLIALVTLGAFLTPIFANDTLKTFSGCTLQKMRGADGDSFKVRFPDGSDRVIRLYAVDCIESNIWDEADSRRLREQRRYFGISNCKASMDESIQAAKNLGKSAHSETEKLLAKPFSVHTVFADGRGSGYHKRIYAFITTADGKDLASHLVSEGLARALGVCRQSPSGISRDDLRESLEDLEIRAARLGKGAWALTNWETITHERSLQRLEEAELARALDKQNHTAMVDPNTAARDELMTLKGIGEVLAVRIIESRPYKSAKDLLVVKGFGEATLKRIQSRLPKQFHLPADLAANP